MPHHNTPLTAPYRAALTHRWRSCTDHALSPRIACVVAVLFLFVGVAAQASATTYYVDPQAGSDTNDGASPSTAWKTVPGKRTHDNTGLPRTQRVRSTPHNQLKCG